MNLKVDQCTNNLALPAWKRPSTVDTLELGGQSISHLTIGRCVLAAIAALHQIVDLAGEFELQLARTELQFVGEREHDSFVLLAHIDLDRLVLCGMDDQFK